MKNYKFKEINLSFVSLYRNFGYKYSHDEIL